MPQSREHCAPTFSAGLQQPPLSCAWAEGQHRASNSLITARGSQINGTVLPLNTLARLPEHKGTEHSPVPSTNSGPHTSPKFQVTQAMSDQARSNPWYFIHKRHSLLYQEPPAFFKHWRWLYLLACANSSVPAAWSIKMVKYPSDSYSWNGCRPRASSPLLQAQLN